MAKYYVTVADSMTQAANTFTAAQTAPDGSTLNNIKVPQGVKKITEIIGAVTHAVVAVIDTGNNFTLQLSGPGMVDGVQELNIGALVASEVGTSVTGSLSYRPPSHRMVDINVKPGDFINAAFAMDGTDCGTPFAGVTIGFD